MTTTIYEYPIPINDEFELILPDGAQILTVQLQGDQPCLWAVADPAEKAVERRTFNLFGTGHPMHPTLYLRRHVGTFQMHGGALVFHLFELVAHPAD